MNRPIKFRSYIGGEMVYWGFLSYNSFSGPPSHGYSGENPFNIPHMQFTGLKDKNGKEIYEGDIVKFIYASTPPEERIGVVEWNTDYCSWWFDRLLIEPTPRKTIEVVGNIYENPDLLTHK